MVNETFDPILSRMADRLEFKLSPAALEKLAAHYELVMQANPLLHLTGPVSAEEFAERHTLESLAILKFLPDGAKFVDIGPGGGFPSIPCLIARPDLSATLIESKIKKAEFLAEAAVKLDLADRVNVVNRQFDEVPNLVGNFITCRALDKFSERLPRLLRRFSGKQFLLFGGPALRDALSAAHRRFDEILLPNSDRRFLFVVTK
ncbi:MAG TPA: class I SAM-dependent methyltransferase [Pyrinomonadaceae bacterium]|nr:class I SAM-dependent methyltransferase [Pyrinomonadaceae bacterium]